MFCCGSRQEITAPNQSVATAKDTNIPQPDDTPSPDEMPSSQMIEVPTRPPVDYVAPRTAPESTGGCCVPSKGRTNGSGSWTSVVKPLHAPVMQEVTPDGTIPLVLYITGAIGVPKMDCFGGKNGCDPYVNVNVSGREMVTWPIKNQDRVPVWNSGRHLGADIEVVNGKARPGTKTVHIEMWDSDFSVANPDDKIATLEVDASNIPFHTPTPFTLLDDHKQPTKTQLYMCLLPPSPVQKTVYFIRHGESTWNEAQDGLTKKGKFKGLGHMSQSADNPLSRLGIQQAEELNEKVVHAMNGVGSPGEIAFTNAKHIYMSPLTRAIQTGLLGAEHVCKRLGKFRLLPQAREKRNLGGKDTSGVACGEEIMMRVHEELLKMGPHITEEKALELLAQKVDISECNSRWWNDNMELEETVLARMKDFLAQLQFSQDEDIIVVGHSHYFREIFKEFIHPDFACKDPDLSTDLQKKKLQNAGVVRVDFDYSMGEKMIVNVEPLFGTQLIR